MIDDVHGCKLLLGQSWLEVERGQLEILGQVKVASWTGREARVTRCGYSVVHMRIAVVRLHSMLLMHVQIPLMLLKVIELLLDVY